MKKAAVWTLAGVACTMLAAPAPGATAVRFLGTGAQMTLEEAEQIAGVDLLADTRLTTAQLANFEAIGSNDFVGCHATPMLDVQTDQRLGTGVDCLRVMPMAEGVALEALSLFAFPARGTLVTFGYTSVQPFVPGIGDGGGGVTHMTGSIPADNSGIVGGTGVYAGATGGARVSGAVNLSNFPAELTFDCLWVLGVGGPDEAPVTPPLPAETLTQIDNIETNVARIARRLSLVPQE